MHRWIVAALFAFAVDAPPVIWDPSPNYTASSRESSYDIDSIVLHTTEGIDSNGDGYYAESYTQAINTFRSSSSSASAHYVVAPWGEITQMVADDDIAWHATYYNRRSIGIECAGFAHSPATWTPELLAALTDLVAYLAERYAVPLDHPTDDANDWGGYYGGTGVIGHDQVQTSGSAAAAAYGVRTDPGPYFPWDSFMAGVRQKFAPPAAGNLQASAQLADGAASVDFSWDPAPGADGYWLDIALTPEDLSSMTGTFQNHFIGTDAAYTWGGLEPATAYYWRVWAYNAYGGNHAYPSEPVATPDPPAEGSGGPVSSGGGRCGSVGVDLLAPLALLWLLRRRRDRRR